MVLVDWRKMVLDFGFGDNCQQILDENSRYLFDQNDGFYLFFVLGMKFMNIGLRVQYQYVRDFISGIVWEVILLVFGCDFRWEEMRISELLGILFLIFKVC